MAIKGGALDLRRPFPLGGEGSSTCTRGMEDVADKSDFFGVTSSSPLLSSSSSSSSSLLESTITSSDARRFWPLDACAGSVDEAEIAISAAATCIARAFPLSRILGGWEVAGSDMEGVDVEGTAVTGTDNDAAVGAGTVFGGFAIVTGWSSRTCSHI